jgi:hypothetical protein
VGNGSSARVNVMLLSRLGRECCVAEWLNFSHLVAKIQPLKVKTQQKNEKCHRISEKFKQASL